MRQGNFEIAKAQIDATLAQHPGDRSVLSQGIFINLLVGNAEEAEHLHESLKSTETVPDEFTDCLYYYGRNQAAAAVFHCQAAIRGNENQYAAWSNAGYAALDNGDFQSALADFSKASSIFYASTGKHTVAEELDLSWGIIVAEYYSGNKKDSKNLFRAVKKNYPQFVKTSALKQLPLVWSDTTVKLIDRVAADLK